MSTMLIGRCAPNVMNKKERNNMSRGITLSKEFGVNPSITRCMCCGEEYGLALLGISYKDKKTGKVAQAPHYMYHGLCDKCQDVVDQGGMMIIEVKDGEKAPDPYRTGRLVGITKDARKRMFPDQESPIVYMEESMFTPMFGEYCQKSEEVES